MDAPTHQWPLLWNPICLSITAVAIIFSTMVITMNWILKTSNPMKNPPPSPRKLPILGNLHQVVSTTSVHLDLRALARVHGPVMLLHFGNVPALVVSSPDAAREILRTKDIIFCSRPETTVGKRLFYGMKDVSAAPYSEYWRQLKSIMVLHLMSKKRVQSFHPVIRQEVMVMVEKIEGNSNNNNNNNLVNLTDLFASLAYNIVCRVAFGKKYDVGGKRLAQLFDEFNELAGFIYIGDYVPILSWMDRLSGVNRRIERVAKDLDEFLHGVIQEHLVGDRTNNEDDFVKLLLDISSDSSSDAGFTIDTDTIKALMLDVIGGSIDTTCRVLKAAMLELLRHPTVMKRLQDEVRGAVEGKEEAIVSASDLEGMPFLKCVIKETLRLHPPLPLLVPRIASADTKVMGYDVAAGTEVIINAWAIGRDPEQWDDPDEFNPERFFSSSTDFTGNDFRLLPFGAGRRICPAISFAVSIIGQAIANVLLNFEWTCPKDGNAANGGPLFATATPYSFR